ncbi:hypothetical protein E2C01_039529 [Portunus trituberculatus]|uniref:Uncharacterized protein n=1 Tax=Portunus trituberculatus TaxID=210409 RepID=A0A5B7FKX4_PORTR|nr:hypothetical protein [Portunus trituberculatus]
MRPCVAALTVAQSYAAPLPSCPVPPHPMSVAWNPVACRDAGVIQERLDSHHDVGFVPEGNVGQLSYIHSEPIKAYSTCRHT